MILPKTSQNNLQRKQLLQKLNIQKESHLQMKVFLILRLKKENLKIINGFIGMYQESSKVIVNQFFISLKMIKERKPSGIHQLMCLDKFWKTILACNCAMDLQLIKDFFTTPSLEKIYLQKKIMLRLKKQHSELCLISKFLKGLFLRNLRLLNFLD